MSKKIDTNLNLISASEIKPASPDVETVRRRLSEAKGPKYWRALEELADEKAFGELLQREFPRQASEWVDPVSRRGFLKLAGASLAMAGLAGCTKQPMEPIVPYVRQPEDLIPGKPKFYATSMPFGGYGIPLLVESHEFRPTKIEGNKEHPASLGASEIFSQASILNLYDPDPWRVERLTDPGIERPSAEEDHDRDAGGGGTPEGVGPESPLIRETEDRQPRHDALFEGVGNGRARGIGPGRGNQFLIQCCDIHNGLRLN